MVPEPGHAFPCPAEHESRVCVQVDVLTRSAVTRRGRRARGLEEQSDIGESLVHTLSRVNTAHTLALKSDAQRNGYTPIRRAYGAFNF